MCEKCGIDTFGCPEVETKPIATVVDQLRTELQEEREKARRFYNADGTFEILESEDEVIERRKKAAAELSDLQTRHDNFVKSMGTTCYPCPNCGRGMTSKDGCLHCQLSEAQERIKELEERIEFDEKFTCHDCQDTGWLVDRTGRYPCTCFTECEGSPYDVEVEKVKVLREALERIANKKADCDAKYYEDSCHWVATKALKETE